MKSFSFSVEKKIKNGKARAGKIQTPHGDILTPAFIPVATKATVKSVLSEEVKRAGAQAVLANTYHLYLQPGDGLVKEAGGLHKFMNWDGPIITDSGGFQVFSLGVAYGNGISKVTKIKDPNLLIPERADDERLPKLAKIGADGVSFKSHLDGSIHYITPEKSIEIQHNLGADIIFAFDECTSPAETDLYQEDALNRTHRWAKRSLEHHKSLIRANRRIVPAGLFGIVQGGRNEELRKRSAKIISEMRATSDTNIGFDGFGIGGSFAKEDMSTAVKWVNDILPEDKPRHLLGIGEPEDLFVGVENGVDLFDCVLPTRLGRNGTIFTKNGKIHITNAKFTKDFSPIEDGCSCYTCSHYSKAYISYLFKANEMIAGTLATTHNLHFIVRLVEDMRESIFDNSLESFKKSFLKNYITS